MTHVPRDASDEQVLDLVREWIDVLAKQDYEAVFAELGYALAFGESGAKCIQRAVQAYRSPNHYPGVEEFVVTDWRTAESGNPAPQQKVTWFKPNSTRLVGAVDFDLPLNGRWSDLTANFVFFENDNLGEGYVLCLEEVQSPRQAQA
jgi:hypothetical protein